MQILHVLEFSPPSGAALLNGPLGSSNRISDKYRALALQKAFSDFGGGAVLDFGCGHKPYESLLSDGKVSRWTGVDLPVRTSGTGHENRADVYFENGRAPLPDASFDLLISTQVLEHVPDLDLSLSEIARLVRPDGRIIITVPLTGHLHELPHDYRRFTPPGMEALARKHGLKLEKAVSLGGPISVITTLICSQLNFLDRIPLLGKPLRSLIVGAKTQIGLWLEIVAFRLGYRQALITMDYLFVLSK